MIFYNDVFAKQPVPRLQVDLFLFFPSACSCVSSCSLCLVSRSFSSLSSPETCLLAAFPLCKFFSCRKESEEEGDPLRLYYFIAVETEKNYRHVRERRDSRK